MLPPPPSLARRNVFSPPVQGPGPVRGPDWRRGLRLAIELCTCGFRQDPSRDLPQIHTCQRRNLAEVDGIEAARVLLKRVVEMLTRLVLSTARRQILDRDRERDRDRDRVGAPGGPRAQAPGAPTDPDVRNCRIRLLSSWIRYVPKRWMMRGRGSGKRSSVASIRSQFTRPLYERRESHLRQMPLTAK